MDDGEGLLLGVVGGVLELLAGGGVFLLQGLEAVR